MKANKIKPKGYTLTGEKKNQFAFYLSQDALTDYISFRVLLENELYLNAIQLACTAVEKLLKALANFFSKRDVDVREHDVLKFFKSQSDVFEAIQLKVNENFLGWLSVAYGTRYTSDLQVEFSIGFSVKHLLAEMDEIFFDVFSTLESFNPLISDLYFKHKDNQFIVKNNYCLEHDDRGKYLQGAHSLVDIIYVGNYPTFAKTHMLAFKNPNPFFVNHVEFDAKAGALIKRIDMGNFELLDLPPEYFLRNR